LPTTQALAYRTALNVIDAGLASKAAGAAPTDIVWAAARGRIQAQLSCLTAVGSTDAGGSAATPSREHAANLAALTSDGITLLAAATACLQAGGATK
jgi:hypothetical protein